MNDIYIRNVKYLKERGFIFEEIEENTNDFSVEDCKNGEKTIKIGYNDKNIYLHSKYNPLNEAHKFVEQIKFKETNILICYGFGFGYYVKEFIKKFSDKNYIFIYEPDKNIFDLAIKNIDFTDIFKNEHFYIYVGNDVLKFKALINYNISYVDYTKIIVVTTPNYNNIYINQYKEFLLSIKDNLNVKEVDTNTLFFYAEDWTKHLISNISNIFESYNIANFENAFKNKPIIIVSAGPSLNKNVELLKKIKDKVLIICVFVAAKVLYNNGIIPDIIVSVVANQVGMFEGIENVPFAYVPTVPEKLLNEHKGKKIICPTNVENYTSQLLLKYKKPVTILVTGGSVACIAVDIAVLLGGNPIILIGQDLAYTGLKYHADGTDHLIKSIDEVSFKRLEVEDIFGNKVMTDDVMHSYIVWFEAYIAHDNSDTLYIDATEGGALIKGTKIMSLQEVIDKYGDTGISVNEVMEKVYSQGKILEDKEKKETIKEFLEACDYIKILFDEMNKGVELSEKLLKICKFSSKGDKQINKLITQLDDIDKKINNLKINKNFLSFLIAKNMYQVRNSYEDEESKSINIANKNLLFYKNMIETIKMVMPLFDNAKDKLEKFYKI